MDQRDVKRIVEKRLRPLAKQLGIARWTITVEYDLQAALGDGSTTQAECSRMADYDRATVRFACDQLGNEAEVIRVLRHELLHVVLAPFDVFATAAENAVNETARAVLAPVWTHAVEQAVVNLERLLDASAVRS